MNPKGRRVSLIVGFGPHREASWIPPAQKRADAKEVRRKRRIKVAETAEEKPKPINRENCPNDCSCRDLEKEHKERRRVVCLTCYALSGDPPNWEIPSPHSSEAKYADVEWAAREKREADFEAERNAAIELLATELGDAKRIEAAERAANWTKKKAARINAQCDERGRGSARGRTARQARA